MAMAKCTAKYRLSVVCSNTDLLLLSRDTVPFGADVHDINWAHSFSANCVCSKMSSLQACICSRMLQQWTPTALEKLKVYMTVHSTNLVGRQDIHEDGIQMCCVNRNEIICHAHGVLSVAYYT